MKYSKYFFVDKKWAFLSILFSIFLGLVTVANIFLNIYIFQVVKVNVLWKSLIFIFSLFISQALDKIFSLVIYWLFFWRRYSIKHKLILNLSKRINNLHIKSIEKFDYIKYFSILQNDLNLMGEFLQYFNYLVAAIIISAGTIIIFAFSSWIVLLIILAFVVFELLVKILVAKQESKIEPKILSNKEMKIDEFTKLLNSEDDFIFANKINNFINIYNRNYLPLYKESKKLNYQKEVIDNSKEFTHLIMFTLLIAIVVLLYSFNYISLDLTLGTIINYSVIINSFAMFIKTGEMRFNADEISKKIESLFIDTINKIDFLGNFESIELKNLKVIKDNKTLLNNINLTINKNDKVLIKGKSGSGKSTLVNAILNKFDSYQGELLINGKKYEDNLNLFTIVSLNNPQTNLHNNLNLSQMISNNFQNYDVDRINNLLSLAHIDFVLENNKLVDFNELSAGQKQRILIANTLYEDKDVYIFDESLSNIDSKNSDEILKNILNLDKTIIIISHHITNSQEKLFNKIVSL